MKHGHFQNPPAVMNAYADRGRIYIAVTADTTTREAYQLAKSYIRRWYRPELEMVQDGTLGPYNYQPHAYVYRHGPERRPIASAGTGCIYHNPDRPRRRAMFETI